MENIFGTMLRSPRFSIIFALCVALPVIQPACATTFPAQNDIQKRSWNDPVMADIAVTSGRALLNHLLSAKSLLYAGNRDTARGMLYTSSTFADGLKRLIPDKTLSDKSFPFNTFPLKNKTSQTETFPTEDNADELYSDLLPLYSGLDKLDLVAPRIAKSVKSKLAAVPQSEHREKRNPSVAADLYRLYKEKPAVTVYLPVNYVDNQIQIALQAMNHVPKDEAIAEHAVDNALNHLVIVVNGEIISP